MRKSQFFMFLLIIVLLLNSNVIFADVQTQTIKCEICGSDIDGKLYSKHTETCGKTNEDDEETDGTSSEFKNALKTYLGHEPSDTELYYFSTIISTLQADGLNTNAIAGILGNVQHESSSTAYMIEGYYSSSKKTTSGDTVYTFIDGGTYDFGTTECGWYDSGAGGVGIGIVQWSHGRAENLDKFAQTNSDKFSYVTVTHWMKCGGSSCSSSFCKKSKSTRTVHIPNVAGQVGYVVIELNGDYSGVKTNLNAATSAEAASDVFLDEYEKPGDREATRQERRDSAKNSVAVVTACTGVEGSSPNNNDLTNLASMLVQSRIWEEEQLSSFINLCENNIDEIYLRDALRSTLSQDELSNLSDWENNIENDMEEDGWIALLRKLVMLVGILFTVWMLFIYISYWFDKLNTFFDLDLLGILTFGMLHISDTEEECTFHLKDLGTETSNGRTVNHRAILTITIIGLAFGVLLISGIFYTFVATIVNSVRNFLG